MDKTITPQPELIEIPVWWKMGNGRMLRRDSLPADHPEQTYYYMKNVMKVSPEDYGVLHPIMGKYQHLDKEELLFKISELENELLTVYKYM